MRWMVLLSFVFGTAVIAALFSSRWGTNEEFSVETLVMKVGTASFRKGGLHPEDCAGLVSTLGAHTPARISHVILDERTTGAQRAHVFTGEGNGLEYVLTSEGLHGWRMVAASNWRDDPRKNVLHSGPDSLRGASRSK